jgi:hypothetical protein
LTKSTAHSSYEGHAKDAVPLDTRYGKIGISAVAAAARYQDMSTPKNPAYAPEPDEDDSADKGH